MALLQNLRYQILLFAFGLTLLTTAIVVAAVLQSTSDSIAESANDDIERALRGLQENVAERSRRLRLLAQSTRQSLTDQPGKDLRLDDDSSEGSRLIQQLSKSVLVDEQRPMIDLVMLVAATGQVLQTSSGQLIDYHLIDPEVIKNALDSRRPDVQFIVIGHDVYQTLWLPVSSLADQFLLVGSRLDQPLVITLSDLTGVDLTIVERRKQAGLSAQLDRWIFASSLPALADTRNALAAPSRIDGILSFLLVSPQPYINRALLIGETQDTQLEVVLTKSLVPYYENFEVLRNSMLQIVMAILLLAIIGSYLIARNLTVPLNRLVQSANNISLGRFTLVPDMATGSQEVKALVVAFSRMNQDLAERERKIRYQASHDTVTGLFNRDYIFDKMSDLMGLYHPFLLVGVHFRQFRNINDSLGTEAADDFLVEIGKRIQPYAYQGLAARIGPSEFCLLIDAQTLYTESEYRQSCQELFQNIIEPVVINDVTLTADPHLSLISFPDHADHLTALNRRYSIAMEHAKRTNEAIYFYQPDQEQQHLYRIRIVKALKEVLTSNTDQLSLVYQPKMHVRSGRITKLEALLRWNSPTEGRVSPEVFVGLAEQTGLINQLTAWVVAEVCRHQNRWRQQGLRIQVSINVSSQDLSSDGFHSMIESELERYQLPSDSLCLEITERDVMTNIEQSMAVLNYFNQQGYQLAVDDYGIGYSALSKLASMPIHELKIDKCFITDLAEQSDHQVIVRSTIDMAHRLGMEVIAEGVEDQDSADWLAGVGCDYLQGYHISRPIPEDQVWLWLRHQAALINQYETSSQ